MQKMLLLDNEIDQSELKPASLSELPQWKLQIKQAPNQPGVYCFLGEKQEFLYVGKAKQLQKRLRSYLIPKHASARIALMLSKAFSLSWTVATSEVEALLLEANYIKQHKPKYNINLRDDKSYPYIVLSKHRYARLMFWRGKTEQPKEHHLFGPFPSSAVAKIGIEEVQKNFKLRTCTDNSFTHRSRPCLQYAINRCSAPCVGLISQDDYQRDVDQAGLFLRGEVQQVIAQLVADMHHYAEQHDYRRAAILRDRIHQLQGLNQQQMVVSGSEDLDIMAWQIQPYASAIWLQIRQGKLLDQHVYFDKQMEVEDTDEWLESLLRQYYVDSLHTIPVATRLLVNQSWSTWGLWQTWLKQQLQINAVLGLRSKPKEWVTFAEKQLDEQLKQQQFKATGKTDLYPKLQKWLQLKQIPQSITCWDIAHFQGESTVAAMVFHVEGGFDNQQYRRFSLHDMAGDDYLALETAIKRWLIHVEKEQWLMPSIMMIDGGLGQLHRVQEVMSSCQHPPLLLAMAKGAERKAGQEKIFVGDTRLLTRGFEDVFLLLQAIRNEVHRFANRSHRLQRNKKYRHSILEEIAGIGPKKTRLLYDYLGGWQGIKQASLAQLQTVPGINRKLAEDILKKLND